MTTSIKIQWLREFPLQEILETAEIIAEFVPIPGIVPITKVIKFAIKMLPVADQALETSKKVCEHIEKNQASDAESIISLERAKFNSLLEIALDDGVISKNEKEFLRTKALEAGISDDEFEMIIISKQ